MFLALGALLGIGLLFAVFSARSVEIDPELLERSEMRSSSWPSEWTNS